MGALAPVIRVPLKYGPCPVQLFCNQYTCQAMWEGQRRQRPPLLSAVNNQRRKAIGSADQEIDVTSVLTPARQFVGKVFSTSTVAGDIHGNDTVIGPQRRQHPLAFLLYGFLVTDATTAMG